VLAKARAQRHRNLPAEIHLRPDLCSASRSINDVCAIDVCAIDVYVTDVYVTDVYDNNHGKGGGRIELPW